MCFCAGGVQIGVLISTCLLPFLHRAQNVTGGAVMVDVGAWTLIAFQVGVTLLPRTLSPSADAPSPPRQPPADAPDDAQHITSPAVLVLRAGV